MNAECNTVPRRALQPECLLSTLLAAAAEPAQDAALGLGGTVLDLLVQFVNLLDCAGPGVLGVGFGVGLCLRELLVCLGDLRGRGVSYMKGNEQRVLREGWLTASSTLAPVRAPKFFRSFSASALRPGSADLTLAEALCTSPVSMRQLDALVRRGESGGHGMYVLSNCFSAALASPPAL